MAIISNEETKYAAIGIQFKTAICNNIYGHFYQDSIPKPIHVNQKKKNIGMRFRRILNEIPDQRSF